MKKITLRTIIIGLLILFSLNTHSSRFSATSSTSLSNNGKNLNSPAIPAVQNDMKKEDIPVFNTEEPKGCKYWLPFLNLFVVICIKRGLKAIPNCIFQVMRGTTVLLILQSNFEKKIQ